MIPPPPKCFQLWPLQSIHLPKFMRYALTTCLSLRILKISPQMEMDVCVYVSVSVCVPSFTEVLLNLEHNWNLLSPNDLELDSMQGLTRRAHCLSTHTPNFLPWEWRALQPLGKNSFVWLPPGRHIEKERGFICYKRKSLLDCYHNFGIQFLQNLSGDI